MKTAKQEFLASNLKKGEIYAGIILGKEGDYHLILLAPEAVEVDWEAAKKFAAKISGELPTRREQSLLFTNLKEEFQGDQHWSSEQHAYYSDSAWCQNLYGGSQYGIIKNTLLRARAVRRLVI